MSAGSTMKKDKTLAPGNVVAHPTFKALPTCIFPLESEEARREYQRIGHLLFDNGSLTVNSHLALCEYAAQVDTVHRRFAAKKPVQANLFAAVAKARAAMGLENVEQPIAGPEVPQSNRFARSGFASRR